MSTGQPELIDNQLVAHDEALRWVAERYARPLHVATGYVRLGGLHALATLPGDESRPVRLLLGAMPEPGLGEESLLAEAQQAGNLFDKTLKTLRRERDFDAFPPSRRIERLKAVDEFLRQERVQVRRYTLRFLHGKAYLFADSPASASVEPGAALVTSANLTPGGLEANLELGLVHYQPHVVQEAARWFDDLWERADPFRQELLDLLFPPIPQYDPNTIFLRALLELYGDEIEAKEAAPDYYTLTSFQEDGFIRAQHIVENHGGVLYADGVGTGKTMIGVEFIREYAGERGLYTLVVAPAQLRETTWQKALNAANLPGQVVSYQELASDVQIAPKSVTNRRRALHLNKDAYRLVVIDEAHAFRNDDNTWYAALDRLLGGQPKALVLLTATPVNNALWDLYNLIMLIGRHDSAFSGRPLRIPNLRQFFRDAGANDPELLSESKLFPLIDAIGVRRDRLFIQKHYAGETFPDGTPVQFPDPKLLEQRYDLDQAYPGIFDFIVRTIDALTMARYRPKAYLREGKEDDGREAALAGLLQSGLLKRFESSPRAALETVNRMVLAHDIVLTAKRQHEAVPSAATLRELVNQAEDGGIPPESVEELLQQDEQARPADDFEELFFEHVAKDQDLLAEMQQRLQDLVSQPDPKLKRLEEVLRSTPAKKVAIFSSFADTIHYIHEAIKANSALVGGRSYTVVVGDETDARARTAQLERFCPESMTDDPTFVPPDGEVDLLLTTDVLSEGQNLQQAQAVISFDMPWNPQRVVQRNGRIIRLKSPHKEVFLYTLLPKAGDLEKVLKLEAKLLAKIAAANASVGMESEVLAAAPAESKIFADLESFADRLVKGDETLLDEGEGGGSGSFAGEDYRARLLRAKAEGEIDRLRDMPWGVGAAIARSAPEGIVLPGVFFAAQTRQGERKWRFVDSAGDVVADDLDMLRLADPEGALSAAMPERLDLDGMWMVAADSICAEHNARLDPAAQEKRIPASQRWARDLLGRPELPHDPRLDFAYDSLGVGRDALVQRALSDVRRRFQAGDVDAAEAARQICDVVDEFGLRRPTGPTMVETLLTPDDLGVVCYQVVLSPDS
jgi:superfamily II DNA or RNA helicase